MTTANSRYEEFRVDGESLVAKVKEILHEGNVRRIIIKDDKGVTYIEVPLTIGVVGVLLVPVWAAIGAIAALAANFTIGVERNID
jgi:Flp pilus assembly pilin Flp